MASVEVDVDLDAFDTEELCEEVIYRMQEKDFGKRFYNALLNKADIKGVIAILEHMKAPQTAIDILKEWSRQPLVTEEKLQQWLLLTK